MSIAELTKELTDLWNTYTKLTKQDKLLDPDIGADEFIFTYPNYYPESGFFFTGEQTYFFSLICLGAMKRYKKALYSCENEWYSDRERVIRTIEKETIKMYHSLCDAIESRISKFNKDKLEKKNIVDESNMDQQLLDLFKKLSDDKKTKIVELCNGMI